MDRLTVTSLEVPSMLTALALSTPVNWSESIRMSEEPETSTCSSKDSPDSVMPVTPSRETTPLRSVPWAPVATRVRSDVVITAPPYPAGSSAAIEMVSPGTAAFTASWTEQYGWAAEPSLPVSEHVGACSVT